MERMTTTFFEMFVVLFLHRTGADICSKGADVIDNLGISFFKIPYRCLFVRSNVFLEGGVTDCEYERYRNLSWVPETAT